MYINYRDLCRNRRVFGNTAFQKLMDEWLCRDRDICCSFAVCMLLGKSRWFQKVSGPIIIVAVYQPQL